MHWPDEAAFEADLRAALLLDDDERAFMKSLDLAARWRQASQPVFPTWLPAAMFATLLSAWVLVTPLATESAAGPLSFVATLFVRVAITVAWTLGETILALSTSPMLTLSLPALALLGLAVLVWPRSLKGSLQ